MRRLHTTLLLLPPLLLLLLSSSPSPPRPPHRRQQKRENPADPGSWVDARATTSKRGKCAVTPTDEDDDAPCWLTGLYARRLQPDGAGEGPRNVSNARSGDSFSRAPALARSLYWARQGVDGRPMGLGVQSAFASHGGVSLDGAISRAIPSWMLGGQSRPWPGRRR